MTKKTNTNKQQNNRILAIVLCVILTVVLLLGGGAAGFFIQRAINPPQKEEKAEDNGGGLLITPDEPEKDGQDESADVGGHATVSFIVKDIAREEYGDYGIMPIAENAQQLTAVITPAEAEDKILDWSAAWKEGTSGKFGDGKDVSEYITVTPTSNGALTANVSCLQAFGEQVIITASLRNNPSVKGTATADYKQGYDSVSANIAYTNTQSGANVTWAFGSTAKVTEEFPGYAKTLTEFNNYYAAAGSNKGTYTVTVTTKLTTVYTIAATVTDVKIEMAPTADYISAATTNKGTVSKTAGTYLSVATGTGASATMSGFDFTKALMLTGDALDWVTFKRTLKENSSKKMFDVKLTTTVNGKAQTKAYELLFGSGFGTFGESIDLGNGLIFGG